MLRGPSSLFSNKAVTRATQDLGEVEAQQRQLEEQLAEGRRALLDAQQQRDRAVEERTHAQQACGVVRALRDQLRTRLAEAGERAAACRRELAEIEAAAEVERATSLVSRARIRRLEEQRMALVSARERLVPAGLPAADGSAPACASRAPMPLAGVAAEAGKVARLEHAALESRLRLVAANTAAADRERQALEQQQKEWAEQIHELLDEHHQLSERHTLAADTLKVVRVEVEQRQSRRDLAQKQLEELRWRRQRLSQVNSKMSADVDNHRQFVEQLRGMAWQELVDARDTVGRAAEEMHRADAEHEYRQIELANLAAAHSQMIATSGVASRLLRLKTPGLGAPPPRDLRDKLPDSGRVSLRTEGIFGAGTALPPLGLTALEGPMAWQHPAAPLPRAAGAVVKALGTYTVGPVSARTPRSDLRDTGQRVLGM